MNKHLLFTPFLALLATSCGGGHITTTPVVRNAPRASVSNAPKRQARQNAFNPAQNAYSFNVSITDENNGNFAYDLRTGTTATTPSALYNAIGANVCIYFSSNALGERNAVFCASISGDLKGQTLRGFRNPENWTDNPFILQSNHLENLNYQGLTNTSDSGFSVDQSIINISGTAIVNPWLYDGYNQGYEEGEEEGFDSGYNDGYSDGHNQGYSEGLEDGQAEGFGLSLAQSQFSSPSAKYDGFVFLPSQELLRQYCVDLLAGTKTFQPFVVNFLTDDFSTNPNSEHNKEETPLVFKYVEELATDTHLIYIYWGDPNWYTSNGVNNADYELKQIAVINVKDITNNVWASTRIAQWNAYNWNWEVPNTPSTPYFGKPITIPMQKKIHRGNFFLGNTDIWSPSEIIQNLSFYVGTPTSAQNATIQEELNILFVGSGSLYAQGYADGQQEAIETSDAYNNVFLIFLPAFSAVATFFNMSVGPFKLYYFFVIPLLIAILVLVIKLVKH